jgi:hypothetical protein
MLAAPLIRRPIDPTHEAAAILARCDAWSARVIASGVSARHLSHAEATADTRRLPSIVPSVIRRSVAPVVFPPIATIRPPALSRYILTQHTVSPAGAFHRAYTLT